MLAGQCRVSFKGILEQGKQEAYAAGELKHGTISLIEEGTLVVAVQLFRFSFSDIMCRWEEAWMWINRETWRNLSL